MLSPSPTIATIRFGYGLAGPHLAAHAPEAMLAALGAPDQMRRRWPIEGMAEFHPLMLAFQQVKQATKADPRVAPVLDAMVTAYAAASGVGLQSTVARAVDAEDGFRERLVAFWANHFTVVSKSKFDAGLPLALVEDAIRPNLTAPFADMLTAVTLHPAMLSYLDQSASVGPESPVGLQRGRGLNENLARELLELHSLGVGAPYSQADVHQMAELLTGLTYDIGSGMRFVPRLAEPGAETVLGTSYGGDGIEPIKRALGDLARRPETARHIAGKLAVHFVADQPDPDLVATITAAFQSSGGDLMQSYAALLHHPAAWAPKLQKVRQPYDFIVAALRALGISGAAVMAMTGKDVVATLRRPLQQMGQPFKGAHGPNGWPEGADAWITPQGLAQRITWAMQLPRRLLGVLPDPADFAVACLGDQASAGLRTAAARAEDRQQGIGLVLASADFNRR